MEDPMNIMAALRQEEAKFQIQMDKLQQQLDTVRAAMKVLKGGMTKHSVLSNCA